MAIRGLWDLMEFVLEGLASRDTRSHVRFQG
jgi:hypothetical protein